MILNKVYIIINHKTFFLFFLISISFNLRGQGQVPGNIFTLSDSIKIDDFLNFSGSEYKRGNIHSLIYREPLGVQLFLNQNSHSNKFHDRDTSTKSLLKYVTLTPKSVTLEVNHHQRLHKLLLTEVNLKSTRSDGYYQNQNYKDNKIDLAFYNTSLKSLSYYIKGSSLKYIQKESGGIKNDTDFVREIKNPKLYEFYLINSSSTLKERSIEGYIDYNLIRNDSSSSLSGFNLRPYASIILKKSSYQFESDVKEDYYLYNYLDTNSTSDLFSIKSNSGAIGIKAIDYTIFNSKFKLGADLGYSIMENKIQQTIIDSSYQEHQLKCEVTFRDSSSLLSLKIRYEKNVLPEHRNFNHSNIFISASAHIFKNIQMNTGVDYQNQPPSMLDNFCISNHYEWNNDFGIIKIIKPFFNIRLMKYNANVQFQNYIINDLIYYNSLLLPEQTHKQINFSQINLFYGLTLKHITFNNQLLWTNAEKTNILRSPSFGIQSDFRYNFKLRQNKLQLLPGLSVMYYSKYIGYSYEPSIGKYYLSEEKNCGGYPFINVHLSALIKNAIISLGLEHANSNLMERNYFLVSNYPMSGRQFKFEVIWLLRN